MRSRHSEGESPKNPPKFERVESANLQKSKFSQIPLSAFCFPFSVCKKLTLFVCPAAVFLFDKSQRKTAAGRRAGAFAPATPFGVRIAENGKRNFANLLFREFKETFLLCKKRFACFIDSSPLPGGGFFGRQKPPSE